ncbi:MAG: 1,4-alpha-glucan branching protein GlgB [Ketobacteraceae bacterium]|nr:1,4-alpha-glucan branching protein GlgB [Ketobacteraceae bacterium]
MTDHAPVASEYSPVKAKGKPGNNHAASADVERLVSARHHDPFAILGRREWQKEGKTCANLTAYHPNKETLFVRLLDDQIEQMQKVDDRGLFLWEGDAGRLPYHPETAADPHAPNWSIEPWTFFPMLGDEDLRRLGQHDCRQAHNLLGSHRCEHEGVEGVRFAVWAPNAERVSVVGSFNQWDGRIHPMRSRGESGVWELFIPGLEHRQLYKYEIRNRNTGEILVKTDPYGFYQEVRPNNASVIWHREPFEWNDHQWMEARRHQHWLNSPISVYEVHLGSWRRKDNGDFMGYREVGPQLLEYVQEMGFTHIQLLPMTEYPYDGSWGYQVTGYFAPTSRFGDPNDFKYFVNLFHEAGIGVLLDWVPAHFPKDAHGLARFDGTALYEHEDPRMGEHKDWGTLIFNYGRQEVRNFLVSSACFWMDEFHIDGLRVDAVASMLYLDYSKSEGEWLPNPYGGNENLDAIDFLKHLNTVIHEQFPGGMMIAEESTAWPQVSRPVYLGGLGFTMKWNMGWMNDTLSYFHEDPIHRKYHHNKLTFSLLYAFSENFVLPLSHDEVVHGKGSMLNKMPGDSWQKFANLRLLYAYQYAHPGKKLLFMGSEFGQGEEWNEARELHWELLQYDFQRGVQTLMKDLNQLYRKEVSLHRYDFENRGFSWIDCQDSEQSVISFYRTDGDSYLIMVFNFTPVVRSGYRVGVPEPGTYQEILNTDSVYYGGSNVSNGTDIPSVAEVWQRQPHHISVTLPPLAGIFLKRKIKQ